MGVTVTDRQKHLDSSMAMAAFSLTALSLPHPPLRSRAHSLPKTKFQILSSGRLRFFAAASSEIGALDEGQKPLLTQQEPVGVEESVNVLKRAARTRRVPKAEVLAALDAIKKAKANPTAFLETLGGSESPGRTWMLIFTAEGRLDKGRYFPVTAVQRFDAAAKRIENGIYLGPIGCVTFEGKFSWKKRILEFIFELIRIKVGPFGPLQISLAGGGAATEPGTKDPFFIWFYVDEEIAVAQGRGGGVAFWCRCRRLTA